jgi:hypothetical protein
MKVSVKHGRYLRSITNETSYLAVVLTDIEKSDLNPVCKVLMHEGHIWTLKNGCKLSV